MIFKYQISLETKRKFRAFKNRPRAFWSFIILSIIIIFSMLGGIITGDKPFIIKYNNEYFFPIFKSYSETIFGGIFEAEADYTDNFVKEQITNKGNWAIYPPVPWDFSSINKDTTLQHPSPPTKINLLGTDDRGRDVFTRLLLGFRISIIFGIVLAIFEAIIGVFMGAIGGYFGGRFDLLMQRFIEIWVSIPNLYLIIIVATSIEPSPLILIILLSLTAWVYIQYYVRAEFLKSRNLEYVKAAKALGVGDFRIMLRHILPNALTLVITQLPFAIIAGMTSLIMLDFLGLGLPPPTPSIGELLNQGKANLQAWWINIPTISLTVTTLILVSFIGEAILDVFDPKRR